MDDVKRFGENSYHQVMPLKKAIIQFSMCNVECNVAHHIDTYT